DARGVGAVALLHRRCTAHGAPGRRRLHDRALAAQAVVEPIPPPPGPRNRRGRPRRQHGHRDRNHPEHSIGRRAMKAMNATYATSSIERALLPFRSRLRLQRILGLVTLALAGGFAVSAVLVLGARALGASPWPA